MNLSTALIRPQMVSRALESSSHSKDSSALSTARLAACAMADRPALAGICAAAVLMDHRQRAAGEVAQAVGEIGVVAPHQRVVAEAAVLAEDHFAQQEIAQRVGAQHFFDGRGAHDVALATCSSCRSQTAASRARKCVSAEADPPPIGTPANRRRESARSLCRSGAGRRATGFRPSTALM